MATSTTAVTATAAASATTPGAPVTPQPCPTVPGTNIGRDDFCFSWPDSFNDETGFRITIVYGDEAEIFVYETDPDVTSFFPPSEHAPVQGSVDLDRCLARSTMEVVIEAILADGLREVGRSALNRECVS